MLAEKVNSTLADSLPCRLLNNAQPNPQNKPAAPLLAPSLTLSRTSTLCSE